ncbi:SAP domain-containing protein [Desulfonatronum sp. SC1]|uniref:SAP domain-containing protein n=1 Tax=Desulfonatronum sp. SC1 TaxID=2109626 RepID=UPI000D31DB80|nr:SAP domain-containing protein [Desulfonatronum sp. SC1]PTN32865.1 SAP domain-containing protein [Desulfonatronum sp. SC1]
MKMTEIRAMAKSRGLKLGVGTTKIHAVRTIQLDEGNFDCFARAEVGYCDQEGCIFREDCLSLAPKQNNG